MLACPEMIQAEGGKAPGLWSIHSRKRTNGSKEDLGFPFHGDKISGQDFSLEAGLEAHVHVLVQPDVLTVS